MNNSNDYAVEEVQVEEMTKCNVCDAFEMMTLTQTTAEGYSNPMKYGVCSECGETIVVEG